MLKKHSNAVGMKHMSALETNACFLTKLACVADATEFVVGARLRYMASASLSSCFNAFFMEAWHIK